MKQDSWMPFKTSCFLTLSLQLSVILTTFPLRERCVRKTQSRHACYSADAPHCHSFFSPSVVHTFAPLLPPPPPCFSWLSVLLVCSAYLNNSAKSSLFFLSSANSDPLSLSLSVCTHKKKMLFRIHLQIWKVPHAVWCADGIIYRRWRVLGCG